MNWGINMTERKNRDAATAQDLDAADLDQLFAEARAADQMPMPAALTARILADADAILARQALTAHRAAAAPARGGFWAQLLKSIGGAPALAGLAVATVAGVWVGVVPPAGLQSGLQTVMGTTGTDELFDIYFVDSSEVFEFAQAEG